MKKWKWVIGYVVLSLAVIGILWHKTTKQSTEIQRTSTNLVNSGFIIDSLKAKNGDLYATVNRLHVTENELSALNRDLMADIDNLNLKIKNLESASKVEIRYKYIRDTVTIIKRDTAGMYVGIIHDDYIDAGFDLDLRVEPPVVSNFRAELTDNITVINEFQTKRKWFLFIPCGRKVVSTKVYIKSDNPYSKLDRIETFTFDNKLNRKNRK